MTHEMRLPNGDVIREGGYGRTRDGRKVGPIWLGRDKDCATYRWTDDPTSRGRWDDEGEDGNVYAGQESVFDIIAAWRDEPAAPVLWRDMTDAEKGALLLAHHEGKVIDYRLFGGGSWLTIDDPTFGDVHAYRVRPEPKRETVALCWRQDVGSVKNKIGTIDLIDGHPDPASIRMEAIE